MQSLSLIHAISARNYLIDAKKFFSRNEIAQANQSLKKAIDLNYEDALFFAALMHMYGMFGTPQNWLTYAKLLLRCRLDDHNNAYIINGIENFKPNAFDLAEISKMYFERNSKGDFTLGRHCMEKAIDAGIKDKNTEAIASAFYNMSRAINNTRNSPCYSGHLEYLFFAEAARLNCKQGIGENGPSALVKSFITKLVSAREYSANDDQETYWRALISLSRSNYAAFGRI